MTDVAHHAVPAKKRRLRVGARRAARTAQQHRSVSFAELVQAHFLRQHALEEGEVYTGAAEDLYRDFEVAFQRQNGRIINSYFCTSKPSAVALTCKDPGGGRSPDLRFHRVSDWATKEEPEIAAGLHECEALAVTASQVLYGVRLKICMQRVMVSAGHLLSLVDAPSGHETKDKKAAALKHARDELVETRTYYDNAANGQGQIYYFLGMMAGGAALFLIGLVLGQFGNLPRIDDREFFACLTAGALGALISVISRIGGGRFSLDCDVGRLYPTFLGSLRPFIGAVFGLALYFAVISGLLGIFNVPDAGTVDRLYFVIVIAFVAGFSERWARDTLLGLTKPGTQESEPKPKNQPSASPS